MGKQSEKWTAWEITLAVIWSAIVIVAGTIVKYAAR